MGRGEKKEGEMEGEREEDGGGREREEAGEETGRGKR